MKSTCSHDLCTPLLTLAKGGIIRDPMSTSASMNCRMSNHVFKEDHHAEQGTSKRVQARRSM